MLSVFGLSGLGISGLGFRVECVPFGGFRGYCVDELDEGQQWFAR